jgi:hypothetical protein
MKVFISWKKRQGILLSQTHGGQIFFTLHGVAPNWMNFVVLRKKRTLKSSNSFNPNSIFSDAAVVVHSFSLSGDINGFNFETGTGHHHPCRWCSGFAQENADESNDASAQNKSVSDHKSGEAQCSKVWRTEEIWILAILLFFAKFGKIQSKRSWDNGGIVELWNPEFWPILPNYRPTSPINHRFFRKLFWRFSDEFW